jgi:hypothetical protein
MTKHRDEISQELWCRVYASVRGRVYMNRIDSKNAADDAVKDFNDKYKCDDYGYNG